MTQPVGVVLAAGFSERMGRPKQLLPFGGDTIVGTVLAKATALLDRVVLVVGAAGTEVAASVAGTAAEIVANPVPERGNLSSLLVAARAAPGVPLLLLMGDMPGVDPEVIAAHIAAWEAEPVWMRVTEYRDRVGHPFTLSPELVGELEGLDGPKPLWALAQRPGTVPLAVDGPMPVDVDTDDDYRTALRAQDETG